MRPGYGNTRGLTEMTGTGVLEGRFAASPIKAWSLETRGRVVSVDMVMMSLCNVSFTWMINF